MPSVKIRRVLTALSAIALAALLPVTGGAQSEKNRDLQRLRSDIAALRQRLEGVRAAATTTEHELEAADIQLTIHTRELQLAVQTEMQLEAERGKLEQDVADLQPRLDRNRKDLSRRLAALYRLGNLGYVRLLFSASEQQHPFESIAALRYLAGRDARSLDRFQQTQRDLAGRRDELASRQQRVAEARRIVEQRRHDVTASRVEKEKLLASLREREAGSAKRLTELEEKARRLERLVMVLSQQKRDTTSTIDIRSVRGALPWPLRGKILETFGKQRDPKFATVTMNNGIKIEAGAGTQVAAVYQGTVLFSQWFKGYGNLIILDHGNRVFTLYGNLKSPNATVGDRVQAGQVIAAAGESEDGTGGYLYFEVRQNNQPDDPQKWLR